MANHFTITLTINDMKHLKVGSFQPDFYFVALKQNEVQYTTKTQNIIFSDSPFLIESEQAIDKIEIWNYNRSALISSFSIKREFEVKKFSHIFQKSNLFIEVSAHHQKNSNRAAKLSLQKKTSTSSTISSISEERDEIEIHSR